MFKRFTVADDVSTMTSIKTSAIRAIKTSVVSAYPSMEPYIDDIVPKKDVLEGKGKDKLCFVVSGGVPLFFRMRDGPYFPTLRLLHQCACWGGGGGAALFG